MLKVWNVLCLCIRLEKWNIRFSLRSKKYVDVSKIAVLFGGGGHVHAAGFNANGTPHDIINNISEEKCQL